MAGYFAISCRYGAIRRSGTSAKPPNSTRYGRRCGAPIGCGSRSTPCRFTPPWRPGHAGPYAIHWDHDPWDPHTRIIQSVLALTDTPAEQGGFCCVPSLFRDRTARPTAPVGEPGSPGAWRPGVAGREIVAVPARAGDLIVWDWRLPHSNSRNRGARPRLAFYAAMYPTGSEAIRRDAIASRQTGRAPAWMRARPGHDRIEPWPPADLTLLGRRLLGLDDW